MLTGMTPATGGSAFIVGRDVIEDMSNIRNSLGVCPQHDILYPMLTVREHLRLYAVLKGVPHAQLEEAVEVRSNTFFEVAFVQRLARGSSIMPISLLFLLSLVFSRPSKGRGTMPPSTQTNVVVLLATLSPDPPLTFSSLSSSPKRCDAMPCVENMPYRFGRRDNQSIYKL